MIFLFGVGWSAKFPYLAAKKNPAGGGVFFLIWLRAA
jgi:hypothetical protein